MNVLSLFDGMSCGQIALNRAGIAYDKYYASEIDKHAIKVTQHNYPNTVQLGDVTQVNKDSLPEIDLLLGGSPCQGFSFAGKQLNFNDPRSALFFEYVRLKNELKPKWFLLENVVMKKEFQDIITEQLGVEPVLINSSLVSAQNRKRLYWTNIPDVTQPEDKGILLKEVLGVAEPTGQVAHFKPCIRNNVLSQLDRVLNSDKVIYQLDCVSGWQDNKVGIQKSPCLRAGNGFVLGLDSGKSIRPITVSEQERLQTVPEGYTSLASDSQAKRMLGNGWTVDVIVHILKGIKD